jgi:hypothetical protein
MPDNRGRLYDAYGRLVARATGAGWLPPGGLTPREQVDPLSEAGRLDQHDVRQAAHELEHCVYAGAGDDEEAQRAAVLCDRLASEVPDAVHPKRDRFGSLHAALDAIGRSAPYAIVALLVASIGYILATGGVGMMGFTPGFSYVGGPPADGSHGSRAVALRTHFDSERSAIRKLRSQWRRSATRVTWSSETPPATLTSACPLRAGREESSHRDPPAARVDLDRRTGIDHLTQEVDPFRPPLGWRHRRLVYTSVDSAGRAVLAATEDRPVVITSTGAPARRARVSVVLEAGRPVHIPSTSPDCVVTRFRASPPLELTLGRDAGDALYVVSPVSGRIDLEYEVEDDSQYFAATLTDAPFRPQPTQLPDRLLSEARLVLDEIGMPDEHTYGAVVRRLHAYFADFSVAPLDAGEEYASDYLTIALARKGVCRHRSRAFFITALAAGIPTRLVENRLHSFCEVRLPDGSWRQLEFRLEPTAASDDELADQTGVGISSGVWVAGWLETRETVFWQGSMLAFPLVLLGTTIALRRALVRDGRGHLLPEARTLTISDRRARRNASLRDGGQSLARLVDETLRSVEERVGVDRTDASAFFDAVRHADMPPTVRRRVLQLRDAVVRGDVTTETDPTAVQLMQWDCYYIARWSMGGDSR